MKGGTRNGLLTVYRAAVPPHGVPGFDELDPRRVSALGSTLRGGVPRAYGGVALGREAPDSPPVCRLQKLSPADPRRSAAVYSGLCEDVQPPGGPGTPVRHGPEQSQSVEFIPIKSWVTKGVGAPGN